MKLAILISALGGKERAAELCGVSVDALRKWGNAIPSKHWRAISTHLGRPMDDISRVGDNTPRKRKPNGRAA